MRNRLFVYFILFVLLTTPWLPVRGEPGVALGSQTISPSEGYQIRVLHSSQAGLNLALEVPAFSLEKVILSSTAYDQLTFPGADLWGEPGHPELPMISGLIGVPPEGEINLLTPSAIGEGSLAFVQIEGRYTLPPAPRPLPLENELEPGTMSFEPDPAAYALDQWFPAEPVQIGEEAWLRDQRIMRVTFFPFQYNPARQALRWYPSLLADITFQNEQMLPPSLESPFETLFAQTLLNYEAARRWRTPSPLPSAVAQSPMGAYNSLGPRFDITVSQDGVYQITYADLQAAGMDVNNVNPATFHLSSQGQDVAIYVFGEGDGSFDPGDYIRFFGEKFRGDTLATRYASIMDPGNGLPANNWFWLCFPGKCDLAGAFEQYTDANIYSLTTGGVPGPRMAPVDGTPSSGATPTVYTTTVRAEESNYWWSFEFESEDVWFWGQVQRATSQLPYTVTFPVELTAIAPGYPATLHAEVVSFNSTAGYPDHHTQFRLNPGTPILDDTYWDGRRRHAFTAEVAASSLIEGTNQLLFAMLPDVFPGTLRMFFDFFEVTYSRFFVAENNQLRFTRYAPGTWKYQLTGFNNSTVEIYDITNVFLPKRIVNAAISGSGPYTVNFRAVDGLKASYYVAGTSSFLTPDNILLYQPPDFASMPEADYLFITHEDFIPALQPLVAFRMAQGLRVAVVDVDDLYREFNDGIYHPIAIKNFLLYTFTNWQTPPTYVTLVGSGHWNFKNQGLPTLPYANPPPVYMPPNLAYIDPWQGQTDAANLLATVVGMDTLPDLYIARLPVRTPPELDVIVNKTLAYETQSVQDWQRTITFIADNIPDAAGDFIALADGIIADYVQNDLYSQPLRIYENDFGCSVGNSPACDAVTQAILDATTSGTLMLNYIGHGSLNRWSGESIILNDDVAAMANPDKLPIVLSMTCLDGYWIYPSSTLNLSSLARVFLTTPGNGAVATYSPTGLGVATGHDDLQRGFYQALYTQGNWELGAAALQGKVRLFTTNNNFDLMHTFTVFGDPAIRFPTPYDVQLTPEIVLQEAYSGQTVTYTLEVLNTGLVTDTFTLALSGNEWETTLITSTVGPLLPGESAAVTVTVTIPPDALGNETDQLIVTAASHSAIHQTDASTLSTRALTDGLILAPITQTSVGSPGSTITYTFALINTSSITDVFNLSLSNHLWPANLSSTNLSLLPGESQNFSVSVQIPSDALGNDTDQARILAQSTNEPAHAAIATVTTTVATEGFTLIPATMSLTGLTDSTVTYVLQIRNLLNTPKYYFVALSGHQWVTNAPVTVGPVSPGQTMNFLVTVSVPVSAATGMSDTVQVNVSLLDQPGIQAVSILTTLAEERPPPDTFSIYLPVINRP